MTIGALQTACAGLTVASLLALGQPPTAIAAHDGAAPLPRTYAAIPTEWEPGGPLAIPTIGVVPPGLEDWFGPSAPRPLSTTARTTLTVRTPAGSSPVRSPVDPAPAPAPAPAGQDTTPPSVTSAQQTTAMESSAQGTMAAQQPTTTPETTKQEATTAGTTTTASTTTTEATSTEPSTTEPSTTEPSTTEPPPEEPPIEEGPAEEPVPPGAETNARGNTVLGLGEELIVLDPGSGALAFSIGVDAVSAAPACAGPGAAPAVNGHLIAVHVRAATGPDLSAVGGAPAVRAADFAFVDSHGATTSAVDSASARACLPGLDTFPDGSLGPDQAYAGVVILDVPAISGTLVFTPPRLPVGGGWAF